VGRVTKITLLHTDATSSEIKLICPIYSNSGEVQEYTGVYLSKYINHMTRYFLSLVGYQISFGSIDMDGNEHYSMFQKPFQIPVGKIYCDGEWLTPEEIKKREWDELMKGRN